MVEVAERVRWSDLADGRLKRHGVSAHEGKSDTDFYVEDGIETPMDERYLTDGSNRVDVSVGRDGQLYLEWSHADDPAVVLDAIRAVHGADVLEVIVVSSATRAREGAPTVDPAALWDAFRRRLEGIGPRGPHLRRLAVEYAGASKETKAGIDRALRAACGTSTYDLVWHALKENESTGDEAKAA
jgi:hypothetical protein